ncbi:MAG: SDR family oxidoreductase [Desulfatirhabdiaceae bacterium]
METDGNKIALVSGGNRGIGLEICRQLSRKGISVFMGVRRIEAGKRAQHELAAQGLDVQPIHLDVNDSATIISTVMRIQKEYNKLDILVNNAGIDIDRRKTTALQVDEITLRQTLETNFFGPLRLCQACIPLMQKNDYGRIVNISSTLGSLSDMTDPESIYEGVHAPAYRLSKAALNALTALFAKELRGTDILINSACPGWVRTDLGGANAPQSVEEGADTPVWLATLPRGGPSGGFFNSRRPLFW